jgi:hypothetical protein
MHGVNEGGMGASLGTWSSPKISVLLRCLGAKGARPEGSEPVLRNPHCASSDTCGERRMREFTCEGKVW